MAGLLGEGEMLEPLISCATPYAGFDMFRAVITPRMRRGHRKTLPIGLAGMTRRSRKIVNVSHHLEYFFDRIDLAAHRNTKSAQLGSNVFFIEQIGCIECRHPGPRVESQLCIHNRAGIQCVQNGCLIHGGELIAHISDIDARRESSDACREIMLDATTKGNMRLVRQSAPANIKTLRAC